MPPSFLKKAGIPKFNTLGKKLTAHSFRHTYATRMATVVGKNTFILKELMGHAKLSTTEIYCQPDAPDAKMPMPNLGGWWQKEAAVAAAAS